ncbi:MAG: DNA polymerase II [Desulfurococcaceae archaeon]
MQLEFYFLDITYEVQGREPVIIIWGITRDGKRIVIKDKRFRPYFYAVVKEGCELDKVVSSIKSLSDPSSPILNVDVLDKKFFGKPVRAVKITTLIPEYVRKYREVIRKLDCIEDVVEADIRFSLRYVIDHDLKPCSWHIAEVREVHREPRFRVDAEFEIEGSIYSSEDTSPPSDLRILAFDIEVLSEAGSPKPHRDPVVVIGVMNSNGDVKQFIAKDRDDREAIASFINYVRNYDPDIIVGYNSDSFDWPYLLERSKILGLELDISRKANSPPSTSTYGHVSIAGRISFDVYHFAEEIQEVKIKSLENIADYLGVMKKDERVLIDYTDMPAYWKDPSKREIILKYNLDDVKSTYGLGMKFLPFAMNLSSLTGLPLDQVGAASVGFRVEWFLMKQAFMYGELAPSRIERPYEPYRGAVVLNPLKGVHSRIAVLDFTSMYPNIMIKYNIGSDTIVKNGCDHNRHNVAPEINVCFNREPPGFFRRVLESLLELRRRIRSEMKKYSVDSVEYRVLDERQRAVKIIANATYGYMGWVGARWYCRECAEAVTAWGRETIRKAISIARELGLKVIYGDTDSLFVEYDEAKLKKLIEIVEKELGFEIKIDKIYEKVFFSEAKKRYAGLTIDGKIDIVGFEAVRGDWAEVAKDVQEETIAILLKEGSVSRAVDYVREVIGKLKEGSIPFEKLVIWKTLGKELEEYAAEAPHVVAARKLMKMGYKVGVGDKIGYVVLKGAGKVSERVEPYVSTKNLSFDKIDINYYIDKQIIPAALRVLEYFGVTENQLKKGTTTKTLFDFGKKS